MEKYEVIGTLGEGSFGRVYKAKQICNGCFVALKVISKRGRSNKELKGFRRECEIQKNLHHPNIIQMLDSFETDNEIVVITEFASKELTALLAKSGYLPEDKVQAIVWDLVSALFYLHSNRVLHRDLKPQNILIDTKNRAKLCDFGFARNMSTGTHVLTSIKGTPLYMAPELIDEQPYDYNADLWSLGCIIYELLMGTPPFCTASILHLIRLIRHEQIQWPTFLSENCISFLKGLLQKNPLKRMTWDDILEHPFVKGHLVLSDDTSSMPLTRQMTPNSLQIKETQRKESVKNRQSKSSASKSNEKSEQSGEKAKEQTSEVNTDTVASGTSIVEQLDETSHKNSEAEPFTHDTEASASISKTFNFIEDHQPIETEEWIVFLQRTMQEIINGELTSVSETSQANVIVSPLRNPNASPRVLTYVCKLLALPFVAKDVSDESVAQVKDLYKDIKIVPNLVYASKLLVRDYKGSSSSGSTSPANSSVPAVLENYKDAANLTLEDFDALENIYMVICHLVHLDEQFLIQFCDALVVLSVYKLMKLFLLLTSQQKYQIVSDVLAILTQISRKVPENADVIEKVVTSSISDRNINFVELLRSSDALVRERTCYFLLNFGRHASENTMAELWDETLKETLEALMYDSIEDVRSAAEVAVTELKSKDFYAL
nr:unnamed protein product [Callosobruchus chinensis]